MVLNKKKLEDQPILYGHCFVSICLFVNVFVCGLTSISTSFLPVGLYGQISFENFLDVIIGMSA